MLETVGELRKDYILDRWVIISQGRQLRPKQFSEQPIKKEEGVCVFCPGNESLATKELGRITKNGTWLMRWFDNKFPALVEQDCGFEIKTDNRFYTFSKPCGDHEIVVETNEHSKQLWELDVGQICALFKVFKDRISQLSKKKYVSYVNVFKNHGPSGGTSLVHSHSQIMATSFVPSVVMEKVFASRKFVECPYCQIIESEKNSFRRCFENNSWIAFTPYASRFNYEIWVFPKKHARNLEELDYLDSFDSLADIMKKVLLKLKELNCSYNFCLHYSPAGHDLHFHIEILPRIAIWGGFELGTNAVINSVSPEDAAKFYRGETNG